MLAIEVELLTGRYVATSYNDRDRAEWPPHPARFFSALVATWAEAEAPAAGERAALEWLERQAAPRVVAGDAARRTVVEVYVPVNDGGTVRQPVTAREKRDAAEAALDAAMAAGDEKGARRAAAAVAKARERLWNATVKVTAASSAAASLSGARALLPAERGRQPRTFPSVTPGTPRFALHWDENPPPELRAALGALCSRLVRLGHSSSLVRARMIDTAPEWPGARVLVPDDAGALVLRTPGAGQFRRLLDEYERHQGVLPRTLPCRFVRYRPEASARAPDAPRSHFDDDWIVFARCTGPRFPSHRAVDLARALRGALLKHAADPPPPLLSGHAPDGTPLDAPHLAIVSLPFVASTFANGQIVGAALVMPRATDPAQRQATLRAIGAFEQAARDALQREGVVHDADTPPLRLTMGGAGVVTLARLAFGGTQARTLDPRTWTRPARRWATATPIALDRNPGDLHHPDASKRANAFHEAEESVSVAVRRIGLPAPRRVDVLRSAVLAGTAKPTRFPPFPPERSRTRRVLVHARLLFDEPVAGPMLLGAGRFLGLGLCRPVPDPERAP